MSTHKKPRRAYVIKVLGVSLIAAIWLIVGADVLGTLGITDETIVDLLTFVPAFTAWLIVTAARPGFLACERHTFKKLLGIK